MRHRFAFVGFRHGHIFSLYEKAAASARVEIVAACEEDAETRRELADHPRVRVTHADFGRMLAEVDCDVVACGDYYARRGALLAAALRAGRHVLGDKPLCTRPEELERMAGLARKRGLKIGCQLDLRTLPQMVTARELVRRGEIGAVHAVQFGGQHPLLKTTRPGWYFEKGKHGGTLNDIAVHGLDAIPWVTGQEIVEIVAARTWNARAPEYPHFNDAGQFMATLANGGGVLGDVSYFAPDGCGYRLPFYWRFTLWGGDGVLEFGPNEPELRLARKDGTALERIALLPQAEPDYLDAFLDDVEGRPGALDTNRVISTSRLALALQRVADSRAAPAWRWRAEADAPANAAVRDVFAHA